MLESQGVFNLAKTWSWIFKLLKWLLRSEWRFGIIAGWRLGNAHSVSHKTLPRIKGTNAFHRDAHRRKLWVISLMGSNAYLMLFRILPPSKKRFVSYFCTFSIIQFIMLSRILGLGHLWGFAEHIRFIAFKNILN